MAKITIPGVHIDRGSAAEPPGHAQDAPIDLPKPSIVAGVARPIPRSSIIQEEHVSSLRGIEAAEHVLYPLELQCCTDVGCLGRLRSTPPWIRM
jgi:hypothetical protein